MQDRSALAPGVILQQQSFLVSLCLPIGELFLPKLLLMIIIVSTANSRITIIEVLLPAVGGDGGDIENWQFYRPVTPEGASTCPLSRSYSPQQSGHSNLTSCNPREQIG